MGLDIISYEKARNSWNLNSHFSQCISVLIHIQCCIGSSSWMLTSSFFVADNTTTFFALFTLIFPLFAFPLIIVLVLQQLTSKPGSAWKSCATLAEKIYGYLLRKETIANSHYFISISSPSL